MAAQEVIDRVPLGRARLRNPLRLALDVCAVVELRLQNANCSSVWSHGDTAFSYAAWAIFMKVLPSAEC